MCVNDELRQLFDSRLEQVIAELPQQVRELMDDVPLVVEDYPSQDVMRRMKVRYRSQLCGLYTGVPLIHRSIEHSGIPSDVIHIYREGILTQARHRGGRIDEKELRRQIRLTILHEYGHHFGMTEGELRELGYG